MRIFVTVICCLWFLNVKTNGQQLHFKNLSTANGLPSSTVRAIAQDAQGYMWFGTKNGLTRFDGYQFKSYPTNHTFIHCITPIDSTHLWIGTETGISILDLETAQSTPFPALNNKHVVDILKAQDGTIYISTRLHGLYTYKPSTKIIDSLLPGEHLTKLAQDDHYHIWIGTMDNGIQRLHPATGVITPLALSYPVNALHKGLDGSMWIGTMNGGLYRYHADKLLKQQQLSDNIVRSICQPSPGKLYIGTEKGLNILDLASDTFTTYTYNPADPFSLSDNAVYAIYPDRAGTIWLGTFFGGINYFNERAAVFDSWYPTNDPNALKGRAVSCFLEDAPGRLLIGMEDGGLQYFHTQTKTFSPFPHSLYYHNVHALLQEKQGDIWIGIFAGGIDIYNPGSGRMRHIMDNANVFSLYQDKDDQVWVGTDRGLHLRDQPILHEGVVNTIIYDMYEDDHHTLWFATFNNGLVCYNKRTGQWDHVPALEHHKLTSLCDDHKGHLWIGTDGEGLHRYDFRTKAVTRVSIHANVIYGIQQDAQGQVWVTTNNGMYNVDAGRHYLAGQQFNYKAFYKTGDGKLYAGSIKGFNAFYPEALPTTPEDTRVSFTNFQLFNKDYQLPRQINYTQALTLDHDQSVISFEFAALHTSQPEKLSYAYKMQGFDHDWNYVGDQRKATYTNLSPGTYTLLVKATTDERNWQVTPSAIILTIRPPFYRSTLALIIYVLGILGAIYGLLKYFQRRTLIKEEKEFYARKIEFFTVMAHEIRTPLSLIIAPLERLLAMDTWQAAEKEQLTIMDENAERLMDLVNQLLDFRKIESDAYKVEKEDMEIISFVQSIYSRFSSLPYQKDIEFTLSTRVSSLLLHADPEVLNKILSNLLINAFKFARKQVHLSVYQQGTHLYIHVEDDGMGIPASHIRNIFQQFFTISKDNHSTGIGLALASALAEKHGARLLVESKDKTIFTLELPVTQQAAAAIAAPQLIDDGRPLILIVEDDVAIQSFLAASLSDSGYNTMKADNGRSALQAIEDNDIDLVITDVMMTGIDGVELCRQVKSNIQHSHIPIVLLTAKSATNTELQALEAGADDYILKPFRWKHIAAKVRNLLELRENLRQKYAASPNSDASVLTTNTRDQQFMEKVVSIIEGRITDPQLSVEELSREMNMSRSNLHKKIKSLSGNVPNELIKIVRLKHAAGLLLTTTHPIAEIAYMTGFSSPSYFAKCFQQQFNVTPKDYAKQYH